MPITVDIPPPLREQAGGKQLDQGFFSRQLPIRLGDEPEFDTPVVTAVTMPLTYSIATGIGLGFITYVLAKVIAGKFSEAKPAVVILALIFAAKFAITG